MLSSSFTFSPTPNLKTAPIGCLQLIEKHILNHQVEIESWFRQKWQKFPPPLYGSVDLRNAGFKLAPVDMNLFPAGFNNLNPNFIPLCIQAVQDTIGKYGSNISKIVLIPENHTRNISYLENVYALQTILSKAGFAVRVGSLLPDLTNTMTIPLSANHTLSLEPIKRVGNRIFINEFNPSFVWLNNDLSNGIPDILKDIEQIIQPSMKLGWGHRLKSHHFLHYESVAKEFAELVKIDPWLITPLFHQSDEVNFLQQTGLPSLMEIAHTLLNNIKKKYNEYEIKQDPFLIMKADAGTYGMSVMTIHDPNELSALNRKQRTHMSSAKGNNEVKRVILQEGIYTFEMVAPESAVAEPVIYMINHHVVGGFYRVHKKRGKTENLNAPGMHFEPLAFTQYCNAPDHCLAPNACVNRFYTYGVIARLSLLAAAHEKKENTS